MPFPDLPSPSGRRSAGPAQRRRRRGRALLLCLALAACALGAASGQGAASAAGEASAAADTATVDAYRIAARARAAADLLAAGEPAAARTQLEEARRGPLEKLGHAGGPAATDLGRLRDAVDAADAGAARDAADAALSAAENLRTGAGAGNDVAPLLARLVRDAGSEGQEAAQASGSDATEPRAYALALCEVAGELASRENLKGTAADALRTLTATVRSRSSAGSIRSATATALAALGAPPTGADVRHAFSTIDRDLDLAVARYRQGDASGAENALIDAYLDNFEGLEPALRSADAELEESLEATLARSLRGLIRQGVPAARFESAVAGARADLAKAQETLQ